MTHIQLLGTGGTIASRGSGERGSVASVSVDDFVSAAPDGVDVRARNVLTTGSYRLDLADLRAIADAVAEAAADPDVVGIVVTHGTDTMEETAFLLDLVHESPIPVVLTGAQRPADAADSDGPRNVRDAVAVAATPQLRGLGAAIVFDGVVRSARGVRKAHTIASDPFDGGTVVAHLEGEAVRVAALPVRRPPLPGPGPRFDGTRVDIVTAYPGARPDLLHAAVEAGAEAVVLAGTGTGNAGPGFVEAVADLTARGTPVVLSTRVSSGPVVPTYGNGGGVDLVAAGAIASGDLGAFQSRILAALVLSTTPGHAALRDAFGISPSRGGTA
ncbi:asparaginase [Rhodococcus rhodnii]|uniref:asparaginase n=2 Tax=Rhodococcus rhodnii TaxID=38312 RepID=R7WNI1_9NOCA|nr:asparaginase [Rhodococcus rhodnii]EOM76858.1 asparaginase [Rhodococcus rhodnii LMG 5362]TXG89775.1 asparaginase [Rhodococcus rhodnii]